MWQVAIASSPILPHWSPISLPGEIMNKKLKNSVETLFPVMITHRIKDHGLYQTMNSEILLIFAEQGSFLKLTQSGDVSSFIRRVTFR